MCCNSHTNDREQGLISMRAETASISLIGELGQSGKTLNFSTRSWNSQYMHESRCFFPSYARIEFHFMLEGRLKWGGFLAGYFHFMPEPIPTGHVSSPHATASFTWEVNARESYAKSNIVNSRRV